MLSKPYVSLSSFKFEIATEQEFLVLKKGLIPRFKTGGMNLKTSLCKNIVIGTAKL